ncbi:hypothetical protein BAE44_0006513 [Dichanthelium oligosanthes]|uniref:Uncharacterized protein n=1 Tax=Dichanthelium oligosanthes TaxID=888268 RepID=A0A1E5W537_9POAL|nr:hypothetical protein BAE44_0006513 [Dichanthelium oligosanthes]
MGGVLLPRHPAGHRRLLPRGCSPAAASAQVQPPTGPSAVKLPVIGNLNLLGTLPHRSIHKLSPRYGPLMSLRFGSFPVVVGSSVTATEFFLETHDLAFLDRPRMACGKYTVYNYSGMVWSHYGAYWRQLRKLWLAELLSAKQLRLTEHVRAEEVRAMLHDVRAGAGTAVVIKDHLLMVTLNVVYFADGAGDEIRRQGGWRGRGSDAGGVQVDDRGDLLPQRRAPHRGHGSVARRGLIHRGTSAG